MLSKRSAGLGLVLGLASLALVDNTMFIGRYCEPLDTKYLRESCSYLNLDNYPRANKMTTIYD